MAATARAHRLTTHQPAAVLAVEEQVGMLTPLFLRQVSMVLAVAVEQEVGSVMSSGSPLIWSAAVHLEVRGR